jgi:hypothetical protein
VNTLHKGDNETNNYDDNNSNNNNEVFVAVTSLKWRNKRARELRLSLLLRI